MKNWIQIKFFKFYISICKQNKLLYFYFKPIYVIVFYEKIKKM